MCCYGFKTVQQYFYLKSDLLMDETGVPRSNHRSATSY